MTMLKAALIAAGALVLLPTLSSEAEAQVCPSGYRWDSSQGVCVQGCPSGYYFSYLTGRCRLRGTYYRRCGSGYYFSYAQRRCVRYRRCPTGFYYNYRLARCERAARNCGYGYYWNYYSRRCIKRCPSGWTWTGSRCRANRPACGAGMRWNGRVCVSTVRVAPSCPLGSDWNGYRCVSGSAIQRVGGSAIGMRSSRFAALLSRVRAARFSAARVRVVASAARYNRFSCNQVYRLLSVMSFSSTKLRALGMLAPRIVDKRNSHLVYSAFRFSSAKRRARQMIDGI